MIQLSDEKYRINPGIETPCEILEQEVSHFKNGVINYPEDETYAYLQSTALLHRLLAVIRSAEINGIDPERIREIVSPAREVMSASPLVERMQKWPRGYPGDFETIELLCDGVDHQNDSNTARFDNILLWSPTVQQHRNKVLWQGNRILSTIQSKPQAKVLSVACGGSRDMETIKPFLSKYKFSLYLNDVDQDALKLSFGRLKDHVESLQIIEGDIFHSIRKLQPYGPYDLILAGGLFDYLSDRQAIWLLSHLRELLNPGGSLCFTNIATGIPYNGWLEYLANWKLIARNQTNIHHLLQKAGSGQGDSITIETDNTGHTLLVTYKKNGDSNEKSSDSAFIEGKEALTMTPEEKWNRLSVFLKQYGKEAISYASLQHGMEYFVHDLGYIAYVTVKHPLLSPKPKRVVLGDPLCNPEDMEILLSIFLKDNPRALFCVISETCATTLRKLGFRINCIGCEPVLDIQHYPTQGDWKNYDMVKRAVNEARKKNIVIREIIETEELEKLKNVSSEWLKEKKIHTHEIWLFARKPIYNYEPGVRKFAAFDADGKVVGFVLYDPIFENGKVRGYAATTPRTDEKKYQHMTTAIHMAAIDVFKNEGIQELNLHLSPFTDMDLGIYRDDRLFDRFLKLTAKYGENIYNFHGLSFHKSKYRGRLKPSYFASKSRLATNELYLAFHKANIAESYGKMVLQLLGGIINKKKIKK